MNSPVTGCAILVAMWTASRWLGFAGTIGVLSATSTACLLGLDCSAIRAGLFGYNGVLVGAALATDLTPSWNVQVTAYIVVLSAFSTVLAASMAKVFAESWGVSPLTLPFNVATTLFLLAAMHVRHGHVDTHLNASAQLLAAGGVKTGLRATIAGPGVGTVAGLANAIFRGIGQLFFADSPVSGVIIVAGIAMCSRIAAGFAVIGSALGALTALTLGADGFEVYHGLWGYNSFPACVAVGGMFYLLTWRSGLLAGACAIATAVLFGALQAALAPWGLPVLTLPFCVGTLAFVVLSDASSHLWPIELSEVTTPEQHLARVPTLRDEAREVTLSEAPPAVVRASARDAGA